MSYKRCPNCMQALSGDEGNCPFCGFDILNYKEKPTCLRPFTVLQNKYMLGRVIGVGGFGITYIGWDINLQTYIAIKEYFPEGFVRRDMREENASGEVTVLEEHKDNYDKGLKRYVEEAQNLSKFYTLPGIVSVKDFFYENSTAYIVMEYINGINLKEYLNNSGGKLPEATVLTLMKPALESLYTVHNGGLVHRDISPDNIMVTSDGKIKVIDFGAARENTSSADKTFTVILKHGYAPPEQYYSKGNQGPWTDIYSLCAAMYKMLTGQVPPNSVERMEQDEYVDPSAYGVVVSQRTELVLRRGLAVKTADRYQNIGQLLADLYGTQPIMPMVQAQPMINNPMMGGTSLSEQSMYLSESDLPKKKKGLGAGAIAGIAGGVAAVIALVVVLVFTLGKGNDKPPKQTDSETSSKTEETEEPSTTEKPDITIENPVTPPASSYVWPTELSNDWHDYMISIDGTVYQFPMPYMEFASKGWESDSVPTSFSAGESSYITVENNGIEMNIIIANYSVSVSNINSCVVVGVNIDSEYFNVRSDAEIKLAGGVTLGQSSLEQVKSGMGAPDNVYVDEEDEEGYASVDYYSEEWNGGIDLVLRGGVLRSISMANVSIPENMEITAADVDPAPPEINSRYVAPEFSSTYRFDHIITIDNVNYKLPVPVSEFLDYGWTITDDDEGYLFGEEVKEVSLEKDGNSISVILQNYTRNAILSENAMVTEIDISTDYCSYDAVFPGGIRIGDMGSDFTNMYSDLEDAYDTYDYGSFISYSLYYFSDGSDDFDSVYIWLASRPETDVIYRYSYEYSGDFK